jgi:hypothetical protein
LPPSSDEKVSQARNKQEAVGKKNVDSSMLSPIFATSFI